MVSIKFSQLAALVAVIVALASPTATARPRVDPGVHRTLRRQATVNLIVTLKQDTTAPLRALQETNFESRGAKIQALVDNLQQHATTSQADVVKMLVHESSSATQMFSKMESLWISNELYVENATFELTEKLAGMSSVASIREEAQVSLATDGTLQADGNATTAASVEWGVSMIKAPDVWATGNTSQGIVVGGIDTGVRATHEVLRGKFLRSHGWFDAVDGKTTPYDDGGHGTLTLGTAVGVNGVGVAPGAKWIGCRGCGERGCQESWLKKCMQFMTCPTDPSGNNRDCSKTPHVINNSWGGYNRDVYDSALQAWTAAGIIPVFIAGNAGPACSTHYSPGNSALAIAVAATDSDDKLGFFSSKGPTKDGRVKPDLAAPGVAIRSADSPNDTAYRTVDGTSHASPHIAGVVALMLSANKKLSFTQVRDILISTTERAPIKPSGSTCGGTPDSTYPNNQYGYGRVNALKAVLKAKSMTQ
jgi:subtilisin family serine protease